MMHIETPPYLYDVFRTATSREQVTMMVHFSLLDEDAE